MSRLLERSLSYPIETIDQHGGFVGQFAGDAFTAFFPDQSDILPVVLDIWRWYELNGLFRTEFDEFEIRVRLTVTYGDIDWRIYRNPWQYEYLFMGGAIRELMALALNKQDFLFSESAAKRLGLERFSPTDNGYVPAVSPTTLKSNVKSIGRETPEVFIHPKFRGENPGNEIRDAAFSFVDFTAIEPEKRELSIEILHELADLYGGFINKLDATDKGMIAIILFGIPFMEGKALERLCEFALEVLTRLRGVSVSISCGNVFAGYVGCASAREYTAMGYAMNLAARLIARARPEEILCDNYIWQEMHTLYDFDFLGSLTLKGFSVPVKYYKLNRQTEKVGWRFKSRFVGREKEIAQIQEMVEKCIREETTQLLHLVGEAGIGKSRLIEEAFRECSPDRFFKFFVHCDSLIQKPLEPLRKLLKDYFYINSEMPQEAAKAMFSGLWAALPGDPVERDRNESVIGSLLGFHWGESIWEHTAPSERNEVLKSAFSWFLKTISMNKPVIINLDDSQWMDSRTLEYIKYLLDNVKARIMLVVSYRYMLQDEKLDIEIDESNSLEMELLNISDESCGDLIESVLRINHVPAATIRFIKDRAMGNPLFTEQFTAFLQESGSLDYQGNLNGKVEHISMFGISDIIGSRIDRMDKDVRRCIRNASVLGMEFNKDVLRLMLGEDIDDNLRIGRINRIWIEYTQSLYEFSHILIRETVYQRMFGEEQVSLHLAAAKAMEEVFRGQIVERSEEIGLHYEFGNYYHKAIHYYHIAAENHKEKYELEDSAKVYLRILSIIQSQEITESFLLTDMNNELASVYYLMGDYGNALDTLNIALDLLRNEAIADPKREASIQDNLGSVHLRKGNWDMALGHFKRAQEIFEKNDDLAVADSAAPYINIAMVHKARGDNEQALKIFFRALEIYEQNESRALINTDVIYYNIGLAYFDQAKFDLALKYFLITLDRRMKLYSDNHPKMASIYHHLASVYKNLGDYERALDYNLSALKIFESRLGPNHPQTGSAYNNIAWFHKYRGEFQQALEYYNKALDINIAKRGPEHPYTAISYGNVGSVYMNMGLYDKALEMLNRGLKIQEDKLGCEHRDTANSYYSIGSVYRNMGKLDTALEFYAKALDIREKSLGKIHPHTGVTCHMIGLTYMELGAFEQALEYYSKALAIQKNCFGDDHPQVAVTLHNIGTSYMKSGQYEDALEYYHQALKINEQKLSPENHRTGIVLYNIGKTLKLMRRYEEAREFLNKALPILEASDDEKCCECREMMEELR